MSRVISYAVQMPFTYLMLMPSFVFAAFTLTWASFVKLDVHELIPKSFTRAPEQEML